METALTERDKKLLYILGFIVIAFIFGWIIMRPMIKDLKETNESIEEEEALKFRNETIVMNVETAKNLVDRFDTDYSDAVSDYYDLMDSSQIDKLFTFYVLDFGLYAKDLTIVMPTGPVYETPYVNSTIGKSYELISELDVYEESDDDDEVDADDLIGDFAESPLELYQNSKNSVGDTSYSGIVCAEVTIVMMGDPVTEQKLLDDILTNPSVRVTAFAWDDLSMIATTLEDGTLEVKENIDKQLTINLNVYMKAL